MNFAMGSLPEKRSIATAIMADGAGMRNRASLVSPKSVFRFGSLQLDIEARASFFDMFRQRLAYIALGVRCFSHLRRYI